MLRGVARLQRLVMTRGMLLRGFAPKVNFSPLGVRPAHRRLCAAGCSRRATAEHLHPWRGSINHKSLRTSAVRQDIEAHVDDAAVKRLPEALGGEASNDLLMPCPPFSKHDRADLERCGEPVFAHDVPLEATFM